MNEKKTIRYVNSATKQGEKQMWIEELPNGKYKYLERYKDNLGRSKRVSVTLDKNTKQAQKEAMKLLMAKIDTNQNRTVNTDKTFWAISAEADQQISYTHKYNSIQTYDFAKKILKRYITDDVVFKNITKPAIKNILSDIYYKQNYSHQTTVITKGYISIVYKYAIEQGYCTENLTKGIEIKRKAKTIEDIESEIPKYLEFSEIAPLLEKIDSKNHRYALLAEFMILTGLRPGEALGLQYDNYSEEKIKITGTYNYKLDKKETPKNEYSYRTVRLDNRSIAILEEVQKDNQMLGLSNNYYFMSRKNKPIRRPSFYQFLMRNYGIYPHLFRHTHISLLAEMNIPLKVIMDRVGHNDSNTTLKIYTHVTEKMGDDLVDKLNRINFKLAP